MKSRRFFLISVPIILGLLAMVSCTKEESIPPTPVTTTLPIASFSYATQNMQTTNQVKVTFDNYSIYSSAWKWSFGIGQDLLTTSDSSVVKYYPKTGVSTSYQVVLTAYSDTIYDSQTGEPKVYLSVFSDAIIIE